MSKFSIDPGNEDNKQNDNAYYNQFTAIQPTGTTPENRPNIRYNNSLFDQNGNSSTYSTNSTQNNNSRSIITDWTARSIRDFKYNILLNKFAPGYPLNYTYNLCDQKLSSVFSIGSYTHYSVDQSVSTDYPKNRSISIVQDNTNNPFLCAAPPINNCQNTICLPGQNFDPVTCLCTTPEECVPQDGCEPEVVYSNIKPKIYGYAFYLERVKEVNIPDIGNVKASCGGGHVCCGTLFRPTLVFSNNSKLEANRNVCMDNVGPRICPNDGSQMPVPGFVGGQYERSDMFEFVLDNPSSLSDARLELVCQYRRCHSGVTFVVLVGETADTNEKVILFSSCVAPGSVNSKVIGTIDCNNDPIPCDTPITPTPTPTITTTPAVTPTITTTPTQTQTPTPTVTPSSVQCEVMTPVYAGYYAGGGGTNGFGINAVIADNVPTNTPKSLKVPKFLSINLKYDPTYIPDIYGIGGVYNFEFNSSTRIYNSISTPNPSVVQYAYWGEADAWAAGGNPWIFAVISNGNNSNNNLIPPANTFLSYALVWPAVETTLNKTQWRMVPWTYPIQIEGFEYSGWSLEDHVGFFSPFMAFKNADIDPAKEPASITVSFSPCSIT